MRSGVLALAAAALATALAGCGSASPPSPPTGVDGLVIPTPSVGPADFVRGVDNPWLPLHPGAHWTYSVVDDAVSGERGTQEVRVLPDVVRVDGVGATAVETGPVVAAGATATSGDPGADGAAATVDYYAQDRAGNVWWLGRRGLWQAGADGAEAGLAMPAHPRVGDGWREDYRRGVVEDRETVVSLDASFSVPSGSYRHILTLEATSDLSPGIVHERSYARGVGLVREYAVDGPTEVRQLLSGP